MQKGADFVKAFMLGFDVAVSLHAHVASQQLSLSKHAPLLFAGRPGSAAAG